MMRRNSTSRRVQTFSSAWIRSDDIAADIPPSRDEVSDMRSAHDRKQALWDDGWTGMTVQWRLFQSVSWARGTAKSILEHGLARPPGHWTFAAGQVTPGSLSARTRKNSIRRLWKGNP